MLSDVGLDSFDAELRVPPMTHLGQLPPVLEAARLAPEEAARAIRMLEQAGFDRSEGEGARPLDVGVKRLINIIERAKQQPDAVAERLTSELMGLGM